MFRLALRAAVVYKVDLFMALWGPQAAAMCRPAACVATPLLSLKFISVYPLSCTLSILEGYSVLFQPSKLLAFPEATS